MKNINQINKKTIYAITVMIVILLIGGAVWTITRPVTLAEDVNNNCQRQPNGKILSTAVGSKYVCFKIPSYKVDKYLEKAPDEGRCVFKKDALARQ